ncbi:phosphatase PAP2 family protein [Nocardioides terrisoli]|uniref:phosphatase PAP2 family protein n=1 Tax=Nocardioides terrisoli TaxID=3388267 RepID=UPI00287B6FFB|nr:phosphatase PAP2 family protein [Nocardioides marmorisolisilvae]
MKRRAYGLLVANAIVMAVLAFVLSRATGYPLRDPDGFLGPAWIRLPMLCLIGFGVDIIPRTLLRSRLNPLHFRKEALGLIREHWTRDRVGLVVISVVSFYAVYVSYRNLKNVLPFVRPFKYDYALHRLDHWLLFGHDPTLLLQHVLGTGISAHFLSWIYLLFLPLVPISVCAWAVWSPNVNFGYWYVTADCLAWSLGTASYYMIPTLGPNFAFPWLYGALDKTGVSALQDALFYGRENHIHVNPFADGVQSVAGFASLHVAITLMMCLVAHYTVRSRVIRWALWTFLALVVVSTTYFGWHYLADDVAGALIAIVSVYVAGLATGQKFVRHGRASVSTTTTREVPVEP